MSAYTEEEAKQKWCPAAPNSLEFPGANCIGSACMWWRWAGLQPGKKPQDAERQGFCGMAGRPE